MLYGGEVAYTHQNLASLRRRFGPQDNYGQELEDEYLALTALLSIGERFFAGGPPLTLKELTQLFNDRESLAASSVEALQQCGLVTPVASDGAHNNPRFLPSRPLEQIRVKEALACLRHGRRMGLGRLLGDANHLSRLVGGLVEQPASEWQDLTVQELLKQAGSETKEQQK